MPIMNPMRVSTPVRLGLVLAVSFVVLAGCGSDGGSAAGAKLPKTSDRPGYSGHPGKLATSLHSPTERMILTVGTEANPEVFNEVASVVHAYLNARAEENWELACSYISAKGQGFLQRGAEMEGIGPGSTSCPAILPHSLPDSPDDWKREAKLADVGTVRTARFGLGEIASVTFRVGDTLRAVSVDRNDYGEEEAEWGLTLAGLQPKQVGY